MDHPAALPIPCQTSVRSACRDTKLIATAMSPGPLPPAHRPRVHTGPMTAAEKTGKNARKKAEKNKAEENKATGQENPLSPEMAAALTAFERHLRAERSLSPHTVRAYLGDVSSLLEHAHQRGVQAPEGLQATHLRSWLASQHASGAARTTLARRGRANVHCLRVSPRLAGHRPRPAARDPEDPPDPAPRPAPGRDAHRPGHRQPSRPGRNVPG